MQIHWRGGAERRRRGLHWICTLPRAPSGTPTPRCGTVAQAMVIPCGKPQGEPDPIDAAGGRTDGHRAGSSRNGSRSRQGVRRAGGHRSKNGILWMANRPMRIPLISRGTRLSSQEFWCPSHCVRPHTRCGHAPTASGILRPTFPPTAPQARRAHRGGVTDWSITAMTNPLRTIVRVSRLHQASPIGASLP